MGVPVVAMWGQEHAGRVAGDFLTCIGHGDLVGQNAAEFVRIASELARDPARLTRLRTELRESMRASPLMDYGNFTRDVEAAYEAILADARAKLTVKRLG
jgi:predicted O-linked N-acetylglucosamine transferase (SPINDLY family)